MKKRLAKIEKERRRQGITQAQLARQCSVTRQRMGQILGGDVPKYKMVTLERIERALGIGKC